jgi:DNA-binding PucR family transcriptional regulator
VYVVVPNADGDESLAHLADGICDRTADALHAELRAGIGRTVSSISDLLVSRRDAEHVLRALAADPSAGTVATVDTVRPRVVLQYLEELAEADSLLRAGKLDVLVEHDAERGTAYVATLRAFFDSLGDIPSAATALGVHANTFRYRLRRLCEVAALDLGDPLERLVLQLQLSFLH